MVLTEEERKELCRRNIDIPDNLPLTREEEKMVKNVRRKIRNKQSAMESRRRKKDYITNLESRVKLCTDKNRQLEDEVGLV